MNSSAVAQPPPKGKGAGGVRIAWLEKAALAAIILGIITGAKVLGGNINLRVYTFVVLAVFFLRLEFMAAIIGRNPRLWLSLFSFLMACLASMFNAVNLEMGMKQIVLISTFMLVPLAMTALIIKRPGNVSIILFWVVLGAFIANVNGYIDPFYRYKAQGWLTGFGRPQSFFTEANEYGQFMVMIWGYFLAMIVLRSSSKRLRRAGLLSALLMFPVFLINNSRGSYLGFALECILIGWLLFRSEPFRYFFKVSALGLGLMVGSMVMAYGIASLIPTINGDTVADWIVGRMLSFTSGDDPTTQLRASQQRSGYQAMLDHPLTGAGIGNLMYYLNERTELAESGVQKGPTATSAFWLTDLLGETGLFGTLAMGLVIAVLIWQAYRNYLFQRGGPLECMAAGSFLSINGMLLNGVSYPPIYLSFFWLNVGMCVQLSYLREIGYRAEAKGPEMERRLEAGALRPGPRPA